MTLSELVLRFVAGGGIVVIVSLLAKSRHPILAGLFVLFPAVTLVSYAFLANTSSPDDVRRITLFSIYSFPTTLAFLVAFLLAQQRVGQTTGICLALTAWLIVASILVLLNTKVFHL